VTALVPFADETTFRFALFVITNALSLGALIVVAFRRRPQPR
jgi:hypothetical protein